MFSVTLYTFFWNHFQEPTMYSSRNSYTCLQCNKMIFKLYISTNDFFSLFFHLWRIFLIIVKNTFCKHVFLEDHFVFWILKMIPEKCFTLTIQCTVYTVHTPKFGIFQNINIQTGSIWQVVEPEIPEIRIVL